MKAFYGPAVSLEAVPERAAIADSPRTPYISTRARVAVYDSPAAAPRIVEVDPAPVFEWIDRTAALVYELAAQLGGHLPYSVIREVTENLIHADFAEPVISVMDRGCTIRFSDQGPGICDPQRAVLPGFSTATSAMKRFIRGVGSGLPLAREFLSAAGGTLVIEENLGGGTVVTVSSRAAMAQTPATAPSASTLDVAEHESEAESGSGATRLSTRQKQVLALVMESGAAGLSIVSRELGVGLSTAHRDLASLEDLGLICSDGGKRRLTPEGMSFLDELISSGL